MTQSATRDSVCGLLLAVALMTGQAQAGDNSPLPLTPVASTVDWRSLTASQRQILAPLAGQWHTMDSNSQDKWLRLADRYPSLPPEAQQRVSARLQAWTQLPDQQRSQARLRYQQARQLTPEELQARWQAYQALPEEDKQSLARMGQRKQNPVHLGDSQAGPREMGQLQSNQTRTPDGHGKNNLVPLPAGTAPMAVAPGLVKSGPGATTSLINQPSAPPLHQQTGLPKITATQEFVHPNTLLPLRGPQGAGMTPVPGKP